MLQVASGSTTGGTITTTEDGNVGIGTAAPTNLLSFDIGLNDTKGLSLDYSGEAKAGMLLNPASGEVRVGALNTTGDYYVTLYADNAEQMRINSDGTFYISPTDFGLRMTGDYSISDNSETSNLLEIQQNESFLVVAHAKATNASLINWVGRTINSGGIWGQILRNDGAIITWSGNSFRVKNTSGVNSTFGISVYQYTD
jgi:hypothetical protein